MMLFRATCVLRRGVPFVGNANAHAQSIDTYKWHSSHRTIGIPRKERADMLRIEQVYDSPKVTIFSRKFCNNFESTQYCVLEKHTRQACMVDMSDDWPDDWIGFLDAAKATLRLVFLTHLHIDNLIGLHPFYTLRKKLGLETYFAYNLSDLNWLYKFSQTCDRYRRTDMRDVHLPLPRSTAVERVHVDGKADVWLSALSNRHECFFFLGENDTVPLQHIHTPGHSMGHTMLYLPGERILFSGDLLFYDSVGRVDLPWACGDLLAHSLRMLEGFPDATVVLPGHGRPTTLGRERKENTALLRVYEMLQAGIRVPRVGTNEGGYF